MFPEDDPEIIIYTVLKRPKDTNNYLAGMVKEVVVNTSKYLNIENDLGAFIIREDNIEYLEETKDVLEKYGFTKIIHNGAKTILIGDDNQKWITTKQKEDRSDLEKAVMIVLLKAEGYSVQDIYSIIELARNTKR